jgi:hypothetical protein
LGAQPEGSFGHQSSTFILNHDSTTQILCRGTDMRAFAVISACLLIAAPSLALADPTGTYNVVGRNIDNGNTYKGTVEVSRIGATYKVVWVIGGTQSIGTGLGSHFESGTTIVTGPASDKDTGLSVGYVNKDSFGIATYYQQPD